MNKQTDWQTERNIANRHTEKTDTLTCVPTVQQTNIQRRKTENRYVKSVEIGLKNLVAYLKWQKRSFTDINIYSV